ncbi:MAG: RNA methyltransferase [Candidatus Cloacimonadota bacterium]|nr:RNA methyltransferase [Candidatus Cloacimonadota bacterium]
MKRNKMYLGLVHYPVLNKKNEIITTSITNLDIHDISRSCITYGVKKFFMINPLSGQKKLLEKICTFWKSDIAKKYNSDRVEALFIIQYAETIEKCISEIENQEKEYPIVVTTTASTMKGQIANNELYSDRPILLLFGTGNGLAEQVHKEADYVLKPITGLGKYNHLSVRSAVAIILDRLNSEK